MGGTLSVLRLNFASPRKRKPESEIAYGASGTDQIFRIRPLRIGSEPESGLRFRIFTFGKGALPRKLASLSDRSSSPKTPPESGCAPHSHPCDRAPDEDRVVKCVSGCHSRALSRIIYFCDEHITKIKCYFRPFLRLGRVRLWHPVARIGTSPL